MVCSMIDYIIELGHDNYQLFVESLYIDHDGRHQHGEASLDLCVNLKLRS